MTEQELDLILVRLSDEFEGPRWTDRTTEAYRRHLLPLAAVDVNVALSDIVRSGVYTRPLPGKILSFTPGRPSVEAYDPDEPISEWSRGHLAAIGVSVPKGATKAQAADASYAKGTWGEVQGAKA